VSGLPADERADGFGELPTSDERVFVEDDVALAHRVERVVTVDGQTAVDVHGRVLVRLRCQPDADPQPSVLATSMAPNCPACYPEAASVAYCEHSGSRWCRTPELSVCNTCGARVPAARAAVCAHAELRYDSARHIVVCGDCGMRFEPAWAGAK